MYFETLIQNQTHFCPTPLDFSSGSSQNKVELRLQHRVGEMSFFIYFSDQCKLIPTIYQKYNSFEEMYIAMPTNEQIIGRIFAFLFLFPRSEVASRMKPTGWQRLLSSSSLNNVIVCRSCNVRKIMNSHSCLWMDARRNSLDTTIDELVCWFTWLVKAT